MICFLEERILRLDFEERDHRAFSKKYCRLRISLFQERL